MLRRANRHSLFHREQQLRVKQLCQYSLATGISDDESNERNGRNQHASGSSTYSAAEIGSPKANDISIVEDDGFETDDIFDDDDDEDHPTFHVGDHVDADWRQLGELYPAVVIAVSEDENMITVQYDEDGVVETLHRMYLMLIARAGTTTSKPKGTPSPAMRPNSTGSASGPKQIDPKWLKMLDRLCEYQEKKRTTRVAKDDDPELFQWWKKAQKDYIERSKRRSSDMGGLQVAMMEESAGWQYHRGTLIFPDSPVKKKKKRKLCTATPTKSMITPPPPKKMKNAPRMVTPNTSREGNKKLFPFVCHEMIMKATEELPHLVQWSSDGSAFYLLTNNGAGLEDTFFSFFRHSKFTSWQRQCYNYDIIKQRSGKYEGAYYNPHFRRDSSPSDIAMMHRVG